MLNKNERMAKLNNAGINTGKYFNIDLPEGLAPGATISVVINENGQPVVVTGNGNNDAIANQIIADGYVRNTKLHRRFVMAQMFHMLNYKSWNGEEEGYNVCLRNYYGYDYTLKMMLEEVKVLSKLEARDKETFEERSRFFTKYVVVQVLEDYMAKLKKYVEALPDHKCKGIPYKKLKGVNIFNDDLHKKVYAPLEYHIGYVRYSKSYAEMYRHLQKFVNNMIKLPYHTPKSKVWIDAYKGEGAYYTLKNLVMFHDCKVETENHGIIRGVAAMDYLKRMLIQYSGEGWRMFALMKRTIEINNFDFNKRMVELGVK